METIFVLILLFFGWAIFKFVLSAGARTISAAARTATGSGTFSENLQASFQGIGPFEIRFADTEVGEGDARIQAKVIEGKGVIPVSRQTRVGFITSVFDKTSGEFEPVISAIEHFQEIDNVIYQHTCEIGKVSPNEGFISWVRLGVVLPQILQPPFGGHREMISLLRMVDLDNPPTITHGFHRKDDEGILDQWTNEFDFWFDEKGYQEVAEYREEAGSLTVMIGICVAMADGTLDPKEGDTIKNWVKRSIEPYPDDKKRYLKNLYNDAIKEAYESAKSGDLSLSVITSRLNEIGEKTAKYEAIELCFDVMAADGVIAPTEMKVIRNVAAALDLNINEIENMRDQKLVGLNTSLSQQASVEDILGIEPDWDEERVRKHLRDEFQKWNNRIMTLSQPEERENCQKMLDLIAEARKKYG